MAPVNYETFSFRKSTTFFKLSSRCFPGAWEGITGPQDGAALWPLTRAPESGFWDEPLKRAKAAGRRPARMG